MSAVFWQTWQGDLLRTEVGSRLKFAGVTAENTGKVNGHARRNFPAFQDIIQEPLDTGRDMIKMVVSLSSAKQAGAVALEQNLWAPPILNCSLV